jgi:hypothetical protein
MSLWLEILMVFVIAELLLFVAVNFCRNRFPWVITSQDEVPVLDKAALRKFVDYSFDPDLGWVRKPDSTGTERGRFGDIIFHIDSTGSRSHQRSDIPPVVATYGDSYTFCRQVADDDTWQAKLAETLGVGVLNYGVGNYGLDQALMRYEQANLPDSIKISVIGFVPETICRVQSYWKHYLEFGNTFAFKPRFELTNDGSLNLVPNIMRTLDDFDRLKKMLPVIQQHDFFYRRKFRHLQFRFPYSLSLLRSPIRQIGLLWAVMQRECLRLLGIRKESTENLPFSLIMEENIRQSHALYKEENSQALLKALLMRFKETAMAKGHAPLVVVMPQLFDLRLISEGNIPYQAFFEDIDTTIPVIDMTKQFLENKFEDLYVNDQYGGHLSPFGNHLVSQKVTDWIKTISPNINALGTAT